jgi:fructose-bisphosphate aldolase, class II
MAHPFCAGLKRVFQRHSPCNNKVLKEGQMTSLQQVLAEADQQKVAVGHFNISDLVALKAVYLAAREVNVPVLVGVSEGERDFIGVHQIAALVRSMREQDGFPIYLNADHTHSIEKACEAAQAGFDLVVFDGSALPFEENVTKTKEAVTEMKEIRPSILVEGEIGFIGSSSSIHDKIPEGLSPMTTPEEASEFVQRTGVDVLAPAVGTMHGMLKSMVAGETKKHVDAARIAAIKRATSRPLTLHGGSGTDDQGFLDAIEAGITIVHINTELRVAWHRGMECALARRPDEVVPYKLLPEVVESVRQVVYARLRLFNTPLDAAQAY